jgi:two-component system, NarL family, sensor histidine kinase LiaS
MMQALRRRFGTLHWKLTGTYVLVSLLLAVTLIAVLVVVMLWLLNSNLLLREFWRGTETIALTLRADYEDANRTPERLGEQLRLVVIQNEQVRLAQTPQTSSGADLSFDVGPGAEAPGIYFIALLDEGGRIITSTAPLEAPNGSQLTAFERAETHSLIDAALAGEQDPAALSVWLEPEHEPVAVVPVVADGEVLGAVYTRYSGIPSSSVILANLPPFLLVTMLPWLLVSGAVGLLYAWVAGRGISRRVRRVAEASAALAAGDLEQRVEDGSADEIGQLARQFNAMADQLEEHLRALRLLADRNAQLAEQAAQLATVEERNRLARDLHDSVSQELFSLTMLSAAARRVVEQNPQLAADQLGEIQESARRALEETRSMIFALRPAALGDRGLVPALRDLVASVEERQGMRLELRISGERRLPLEHEQALFRIVQEALTNVARHSGVREASVSLGYEDDHVELLVSDRGQGFDPRARRSPGSVGLASMAERASALGGELAVESAPGSGTAVRVRLPVRM